MYLVTISTLRLLVKVSSLTYFGSSSSIFVFHLSFISKMEGDIIQIRTQTERPPSSFAYVFCDNASSTSLLLFHFHFLDNARPPPQRPVLFASF
uniref:Secreted protein n=1 Tax=Caenorhabditis tropicalis TaxID=1561998 RepID=A0A1I7T663_9PELO